MVKIGAFTAVAAFMVLFALPLSAQPGRGGPGGPGGPPDPERKLEMLTDWLDLTDDQVELIKPIIEENHLRRQEIFENADGDRETVRDAMEELHKETLEQFAEILTEQQLEKFKETMGRRGPRPGGPGGPHPF